MNRMCTRCVMDTSAPDITFDAQGICSYCTRFLEQSRIAIQPDPSRQHALLQTLVAEIRRRRGRKAYDCVVGVSGGVDSSWVLVQAVKMGLRPLAVHMDNGWNSELAQNNVANLIRALGVDLQTHVIHWPEYRALMQAFFDADVVDVELLYDNAMLAVNYQQAARLGVRHMLSGVNHVTEGMIMPPTWAWSKFDRRNIVSIARRSGVKLRTFPSIGTLGRVWWGAVRGIRWVRFLDLLDFNKAQALDTLESQFGYKRYPYKHYESIFTRFYQGYILPTKFGVDKRRLHFSTLVMSGQMRRDEAISGLQGIAYPNEQALEEDKSYFLKRMGWTAAELNAYLQRPGRSHAQYGSEVPLIEWCMRMRDRLLGSPAT